jgi:hypothetical protein
MNKYEIMMDICGFRRNCGRSATTSGKCESNVYNR